MYKMVGTPSKFRNRVKRKSDLDIFDESITKHKIIYATSLPLQNNILPLLKHWYLSIE